MMRVINKLGFKQKLFILVLVPLLACLYFSLNTLVDTNNKRESLENIQQLLSLTVLNNALVHELQKERGMTAVYLGTEGEEFALQLSNQREKTSQALNNLTNNSNEFTSNVLEVNRIFSTIKQELSQLDATRAQVTNLSISSELAISYYTNLNNKVLQLTGFFISLSPKETVRSAIAYYNFLEAKERAGIERAVVSTAFAGNSFTANAFQKFISLDATQQTFLAQFSMNSSNQSQRDFSQKMDNNAVVEVRNMRRLAKRIGAQGPFNIEADFWFSQATQRINLLKEYENVLADDFTIAINKLFSLQSSKVLSTLSIVLMVVVITGAVVWLILTNLFNQLNFLSSTLIRVKDDHDLTARAKVLGSDELGQLASALNETLATFSGAIDQIGHSSIELSASAQQSADTVEKNSLSLLQQQNETGQVATAVEEMSASVQEVARNTSTAMIAAHQANEKAIESQSVVDDSLNAINTLVGDVDEVSQQISGLHSTSSTISGVIDVIKGIAEQTNLLALNAAIEAARAGEQGRGFAVVADEVRTLAQRTQESTVEIEEIINKLQNQANNAHTMISGTQERAKETVQGTHQIELSLTQVVTSISDINAMVEQIAAAAEEQVNVTQEINRNISDIDDKSQEVSLGAQEVSEAANSQAVLANNLQTLAARFAI